MAVASITGRQVKRVKDELNRNAGSTRSSSRETPVSSTEGDYDEDDDEDEDEAEDDEDEDEEDDEIDEEEEEREPEKIRFDEHFLAQLLAFDPSLGTQNASHGGNAQSTSSFPGYSFNDLSHNNNKQQQQQLSQQGNLDNVSLPMSESAPLINQSAHQTSTASTVLPPSAPTPSNEFYDGAINFLTEVLGSSTPSFWNGDTGLPNSVGDVSWTNPGKTPITAPSPQAAGTDFKNLQPLIGNLIARLKGLPVQDGQQSGQKLEDDLVILLQSLMAHRQAQQNRQAQEQLNHSLSMLQQQSSSLNNPAADMSNFASSTSLSNQPHADNSKKRHDTTTSTQMFPSQPGFSIVDFDFGDDDDDPDFVPNNVNLDFANSQDFANALAHVSAAPVAPLPSSNSNGGRQDIRDDLSLTVDDASWQQVMDSLQKSNSATTTTAAAAAAAAASNMEQGPSFGSSSADGRARRTRSTTRNVYLQNDGDNDEAQKGNQGKMSSTLIGLNNIDLESEEEHSEGNEAEGGESSRLGEKKRGRKALSKEEALERRRESNRECSRRSRMRKKQEEEEIRQEFVRMRNLRSVSQEAGAIYGGGHDSKDLEDLPAGLRRKKKGRPFGSKSYAKTEESAQAENEEKVADLKADNRMLRAEMQRLIEENAQLRARLLHYEGNRTDRVVKTRTPWTSRDATSTKGSAFTTSRDKFIREVEEEEEEEYDDNDDDEITMEEFMARSRAARDLPYDPSKIFQLPSSYRRSTQDQRNDGRSLKRRRAEVNDRSEQLLPWIPT